MSRFERKVTESAAIKVPEHGISFSQCRPIVLLAEGEHLCSQRMRIHTSRSGTYMRTHIR